LEVARLAGLPETVLTRAQAIFAHTDHLEGFVAVESNRLQSASVTTESIAFSCRAQQEELIRSIRDVDTSSLRPIDALVFLDELKNRAAKALNS
jgi:DNA mismatch repair ATPase MutS